MVNDTHFLLHFILQDIQFSFKLKYNNLRRYNRLKHASAQQKNDDDFMITDEDSGDNDLGKKERLYKWVRPNRITTHRLCKPLRNNKHCLTLGSFLRIYRLFCLVLYGPKLLYNKLFS